MSQNNGTSLKIIGWVLGVLMMVGGWLYAGMMASFTKRVEALEQRADHNASNIMELMIWKSKEEEWFKNISEKLDILMKQH